MGSAAQVPGSSGPTAGTPVPFRMSRTIASLLTAWLKACRTRLSVNGFLSTLKPTYQTVRPVFLCTVTCGVFSSLSMKSGAMGRIRSTPPVSSSVTRVVASGIAR
jgi:hypothetical protein